MMKVTLRISSLLFVLLSWSVPIWAQPPANDDCGGAFVVPFSESEANVILVEGDTRGATASTVPNGVCSTVFYTDDIFFQFTTPATVEDAGIVVRAYFDNSSIGTDVSAIGMALYASCDPGEVATHCFSSTVPEDDRFEISGLCLLTSHTYTLRVWSTGGDATTEGTLRIGVYPNEGVEPFLWCETFGGGLEANGWTTSGTCDNPDSNANAVFVYLPEGLIDQGAYAAPGYRVSGASYCDGAVGVDSDYNDNLGIPGNFGAGPCPTPGTKFLVSPAIYSGGWNVAGLTLSWTQAIRQYQSTYFISFRTKDVGGDWTEWGNIPVNQEFPINSAFFDSDIQRFFMPGAAGHDSLQIRFVYNDNYYLWAIDDVKLVETECNNMRVQSNFYAIPPWVQIPADQVREFAALSDIYNAGACPQKNVVLTVTVTDTATGAVVYNRSLNYGTIDPDSLAENRLFPELVDLPPVAAGYQITYSLTSDAPDFDPSDNVISYFFMVGNSDVFAHEDGFTRSVAVNGAIYDAGAPLSYAYGNVFLPQNDVVVDRIIWGVNNPGDMMGKTVSVYLLQWTDTNGDLIAEASERRFVGYNDYTFTGNEGDNVILETNLENFDNPGEDIYMRAGFQYIALVEYVASTADDPQFFLLANDTRDFSAQVLAMDSAFAQGLTEDRVFMTALGFSPDGNIANIDYEVRELDVDDNRIYFGDNIVPLIRVGIKGVNTHDELPLENLVSVFPNPATDEVRIKLEFSNPYDDVQLRLLNPLGQVVFERVLTATITNHTELISVRDLAAGNYLLQVETSDGQRSIPVMVIK